MYRALGRHTDAGRRAGRRAPRPPRVPDAASAGREPLRADRRRRRRRSRIARQFVDQLATLHRLDASALDLPELGAPGALSGHVLDEIAEWEQQYAAAGGGVPVISLACAWLRANVPADDGWPVVLVQGDTGPGNFMFDDDRLVAVTDWELAHWGDVHDDLAWVLVRDTLERFPDLEARFADYERASGFTIEPARLRYFRVLAQCRSTIGTLAGLRSRDRARRDRVAADLQHAAHPVAHRGARRGGGARARAAARTRVRRRRAVVGLRRRARRPARRRAPGARRRLRRHPRQGRRAPPQVPPGGGPPRARVRRGRAGELGELLGQPVDDVEAGRRALCAAIEQRRGRPPAPCSPTASASRRGTPRSRGPAMGSLADRHFTPVRQLHEEGP